MTATQENTWTTCHLNPPGPIQLSKLRKTLRHARRKVNGYRELIGVHGGQWSEHFIICLGSTPESIRAGVQAYGAALAEMLAPIVAAHSPLTRANIGAATKALEALDLASIDHLIPTKDDRRTPETEAAIQARMAEQAAKVHDSQRAKAEALAPILSRKPANAHALIVAELIEDKSDHSSDYFGSTVTRAVAIGWRTGSREDFRQLRKAAASFPETAHMGPGCDTWTAYAYTSEDQGPHVFRERKQFRDEHYNEVRATTEAELRELIAARIAADSAIPAPKVLQWGDFAERHGFTVHRESVEHRENYSMGAGNYLKRDGRHACGWRVRSYEFSGSELAWAPGAPLEDGLTGPAPAPAPQAVGTFNVQDATNKKGPFALAVPVERLEREAFEELRDSAKRAGGWYSRKWGRQPGGFGFNSKAAALAWLESMEHPTPNTPSGDQDDAPASEVTLEQLAAALERMPVVQSVTVQPGGLAVEYGLNRHRFTVTDNGGEVNVAPEQRHPRDTGPGLDSIPTRWSSGVFTAEDVARTVAHSIRRQWNGYPSRGGDVRFPVVALIASAAVFEVDPRATIGTRADDGATVIFRATDYDQQGAQYGHAVEVRAPFTSLVYAWNDHQGVTPEEHAAHRAQALEAFRELIGESDPTPTGSNTGEPNPHADKLRKLANALQAKIDHHRAPLTQNWTARRQRIKDGQLQQARSLEQVQRALYALADASPVPECLAHLNTRAAVERVLDSREDSPERQALIALAETKRDPEAETKRAEAKKLADLENQVRTWKVPGFFPTPPAVVAQILEAANLNGSTLTVLEPSAGIGSILEAIPPHHSVTAFEVSAQLAEILEAKNLHATCADFLEQPPAPLFDRVLMNPPFERKADQVHVRHAIEFLKPGGILVAIMSPAGAEAIEKQHPDDTTAEALPAGSFNGADAFRSTGVQVSLVVFRKPTRNRYEDRIEDRRERLETAADKAANRAEQAWSRSRKATEGIPLGQPILVGHHSEKRHRRDVDRSARAADKALEEQRTAAELRSRAFSTGGGGVSADDPEAIQKLRDKLATMEAKRERIKAHNKKHRGTADAFPAYVLSNLGANIRRVEQRIEDLTRERREPDREPIVTDAYTIEEDREANRVLVTFADRLTKEQAQDLKRQGFRWSRSRGAWSRQRSASAWYWAEATCKRFAGETPPPAN